jgi:hypothetical protein
MPEKLREERKREVVLKCLIYKVVALPPPPSHFPS